MYDLKWTNDFDFNLISKDNYMNLEIFEDEEAYTQVITNRIKSISKDWFYDNVGADLEQLMGKLNTQDTAQFGSNLITKILTYDGLVKQNDIYIVPKAVSDDTLLYFVFIKSPYTHSKLTFQTEISLSGKSNIEFIKK